MHSTGFGVLIVLTFFLHPLALSLPTFAAPLSKRFPTLDDGLIFYSHLSHTHTGIQNLRYEDDTDGEVPPHGISSASGQALDENIIFTADEPSHSANTSIQHDVSTSGIHFFYAIDASDEGGFNIYGLVRYIGSDVLGSMMADAVEGLAENSVSVISWDLIDTDNHNQVIGTITLACGPTAG